MTNRPLARAEKETHRVSPHDATKVQVDWFSMYIRGQRPTGRAEAPAHDVGQGLSQGHIGVRAEKETHRVSPPAATMDQLNWFSQANIGLRPTWRARSALLEHVAFNCIHTLRPENSSSILGL